MCSLSSFLEISDSTKIALSPSSVAAVFPRSVSISAITTRAPSLIKAFAMPLPIPSPAPVITATLFSSWLLIKPPYLLSIYLPKRHENAP